MGWSAGKILHFQWKQSDILFTYLKDVENRTIEGINLLIDGLEETDTDIADNVKADIKVLQGKTQFMSIDGTTKVTDNFIIKDNNNANGFTFLPLAAKIRVYYGGAFKDFSFDMSDNGTIATQTYADTKRDEAIAHADEIVATEAKARVEGDEANNEHAEAYTDELKTKLTTGAEVVGKAMKDSSGNPIVVKNYASKITYNYIPGTGVLVISLLNQDNQEISSQTIDLPTEQIINNFEYDAKTASLVFTKIDGHTVKVPLKSLIDTYTGGVTDTATVTVDSDNKIIVDINKGSITLDKLAEDFQNTWNSWVEAESARVTAETKREQNEATRKSNETSRVNAEASRVNAEKARVTAETERANSFAKLKSDTESDLATYKTDTTSALNEKFNQFGSEHSAQIANLNSHISYLHGYPKSGLTNTLIISANALTTIITSEGLSVDNILATLNDTAVVENGNTITITY